MAASIVERKQKERIRERYFKQSMDRESEKDNLNIQELDYKQFEKSRLQEFMKVGHKEEVPYFIDEMFEKLDHSAVKSRIFRQYIVMDAYFCGKHRSVQRRSRTNGCCFGCFVQY